jgi:hypothetical protein
MFYCRSLSWNVVEIFGDNIFTERNEVGITAVVLSSFVYPSSNNYLLQLVFSVQKNLHFSTRNRT